MFSLVAFVAGAVLRLRSMHSQVGNVCSFLFFLPLLTSARTVCVAGVDLLSIALAPCKSGTSFYIGSSFLCVYQLNGSTSNTMDFN